MPQIDRIRATPDPDQTARGEPRVGAEDQRNRGEHAHQQRGETGERGRRGEDASDREHGDEGRRDRARRERHRDRCARGRSIATEAANAPIRNSNARALAEKYARDGSVCTIAIETTIACDDRREQRTASRTTRRHASQREHHEREREVEPPFDRQRPRVQPRQLGCVGREVAGRLAFEVHVSTEHQRLANALQQRLVVFGQQHEAAHHDGRERDHDERGQQPLDATPVELEQPGRRGTGCRARRAIEDRCDQVARDHEEQVDADVAAADHGHAEVERDDEGDRDRLAGRRCRGGTGAGSPPSRPLSGPAATWTGTCGLSQRSVRSRRRVARADRDAACGRRRRSTAVARRGSSRCVRHSRAMRPCASRSRTRAP